MNFQSIFCIGNHFPSHFEGIQSYWNKKQIARHQFQFWPFWNQDCPSILECVVLCTLQFLICEPYSVLSTLCFVLCTRCLWFHFNKVVLVKTLIIHHHISIIHHHISVLILFNNMFDFHSFRLNSIFRFCIVLLFFLDLKYIISLQ